jgi:hypothetical protein
MNGNKFKGNKPKKSGRGRKEVYADFNPKTDHYGRIVNIEGGKHVSVVLLDSPDTKPISATIRGIHHKKVWFKKDDLVIVRDNGNMPELWGKVSENECNKVRRFFDKNSTQGNNDANIFQNANDSDDEEGEDEDENAAKKTPMTTNSNVFSSTTNNQKKSTLSDIIVGEDGEINIDDI